MYAFEEVFVDETKNGVKLKSEEYHLQGKNIIVDQGQSEIAGYTDLDEGIYSDIPALIFGDHTRIVKYVDKPFFLGADGVKVLKCKFEGANYKYLYYVLKNAKIPNTGYNRHFKWLKEIRVSYPEMAIQEQIVTTLDKVQMVIDSRKCQLEELDNLIKSRFVEMFGEPDENSMGWIEKPLSEYLDVVGGYAFKSELFVEEGIPVLRIGNINAGYFKPVNMVYWDDDSSLERYKIYPGDLVMSLTGTVGKDDYGNVCVLGNEYDEYYLNQRNAKLNLKQGLNKYYLSYLLKFEQIKKRLTGISRGVRQANISNKDILSLCVPIPNLKLQEQFAAFVNQTDKLKVEVQKSLDEAQQLMDSLMQKYFG